MNQIEEALYIHEQEIKSQREKAGKAIAEAESNLIHVKHAMGCVERRMIELENTKTLLKQLGLISK